MIIDMTKSVELQGVIYIKLDKSFKILNIETTEVSDISNNAIIKKLEKIFKKDEEDEDGTT